MTDDRIELKQHCPSCGHPSAQLLTTEQARAVAYELLAKLDGLPLVALTVSGAKERIGHG